MAFTVEDGIVNENVGSLNARHGFIANTIGTSGGTINTGLNKVHHISFEQVDTPPVPANARNVQIDLTNAVTGFVSDSQGNVDVVVDGTLDTRYKFIAFGY